MSTEYQIALGEFRFKLGRATYDELTRTTHYSWAKQDLIQTRPAYQSVGMGEDSIQLKGVVFNYKSNMSLAHQDQLAELRRVAFDRKPLRLALESGVNMGYWAIQSIEEVQSHLIVNAPMRQAFNIQLAYLGENA